MIEFDIRTLLVAHASVTLTLGTVLLLFWSTQRTMRCIAVGAVGTAMLGIAVLGISLRGAIPDIVSIVMANSVGVLGLSLIWTGTRMFAGAAPRPDVVAGLVLGMGGCMYWWTAMAPSNTARVIVGTAIWALVTGACGRELLHRRNADSRPIALLAGGLFATASALLAVRSLDGLLHPELLTLQPVPSMGLVVLVTMVTAILTVFCFVLMVSQRLRAELVQRDHGMAALAGERDIARWHAEEAMRAKASFLSVISHELRTPLNAIIGLSELQAREPFGPMGHPRYREYADDVNASGRHLLNLVESMLDLSRVEAGVFEINPTAIELRPLLLVVQRLVASEAAARKLRCVVEIPELTCHADARALTQILVQLMNNAIKFTGPPGSIRLGVHGLPNGGARFVVSDDGIGMDPEDLPRLLRPFEQASPSYVRSAGGVGLGLPLVVALVELHGGRLEFDTALGWGTVATITLPGIGFLPGHVKA